MIISKSNNIIKMIRSLKEKKYREKYNKYVIEGPKIVKEIVDSKEEKTPFEFIVYSKDIISKINGYSDIKKVIESLKKDNKNKIIEVSKDIFEYITETVTPQGVLTVLPLYKQELSNFRENINGKYIILDKIQDPGNIGTIIRSALSFNVKNIICKEGSVDVYCPKVIRSTMGAILKVNIYQEKAGNIKDYIDLLKASGYKIICTDLNAKEYLSSLVKTDKNVYIFGNEASGISKELLKLSDKCIKIEMEDIQESLNVSQAASICMYEEYIKNHIK